MAAEYRKFESDSEIRPTHLIEMKSRYCQIKNGFGVLAGHITTSFRRRWHASQDQYGVICDGREYGDAYGGSIAKGARSGTKAAVALDGTTGLMGEYGDAIHPLVQVRKVNRRWGCSASGTQGRLAATAG